jgi:hypothetical protein
MSLPYTHLYYVSNIIEFTDTFSERVHAAGMKNKELQPPADFLPQIGPGKFQEG